MTDSEFRATCLAAFAEFVKLVPNPKTRYKKGGSTGNMALNAAKIVFPTPTTCEIYVDENIAPYLPYTNAPWVSAKWKGKKNPNEGWFQKAADYITNYIATRINGDVN